MFVVFLAGVWIAAAVLGLPSWATVGVMVLAVVTFGVVDIIVNGGRVDGSSRPGVGGGGGGGDGGDGGCGDGCGCGGE